MVSNVCGVLQLRWCRVLTQVVARLPSGADLLHADTIALIDGALAESSGHESVWTAADVGVPASLLFVVLLGYALAGRGGHRLVWSADAVGSRMYCIEVQRLC